ncbi:S1C family serine protease [Streptomyces sp. NRRL S-118]|uniref:S1C family serine protease n=1 Tax=Streptomyces sp. NRRL S-118 TaxID=1463881 RepID=UPI0004CA9E18|nr:S1C family serine protease [Streptomyces sp. NRRL S-118]
MERGDRATLVKICDPAGRLRGTGFATDDLGTVVTSHEAVDGLVRVVLHAPGGRTFTAGADAITPLPGAALALVRTEGLGLRPLPLAGREHVEPGGYVRIAAGGWRQARVLGTADVTYTATDRFHHLGGVLELAIGTEGSEALRLGGEAAGGPVVDAETGAVLAVLGTALHAERRAAGFAVPLAAVAAQDPDGPLAALLRRSAATVPAYGRDLNLAGVLELTATSGGAIGGPGHWPDPVERAGVARAYELSAASGTPVLGLVGEPGTGRTTELAAIAARRARGAEPAPTVWLRGADLRADDSSVADAVGRALRRAGRIVAASGRQGLWDESAAATPERIARLARTEGRPLLVLLDSPEEMPPQLAHRLPDWTGGTATWLRAHHARLLIACRPEHWEQAGPLYPAGTVRRVPVGDLTAREARRARARYGVPGEAVAAEDARHPLALRLLAEVREALPGEVPGRPGRDEIFTAHLDLMCLRIAVRLAAAARPPVRGTAVRRLAARVSGRVHEAARRCLGAGQGELDRAAFEELFPWNAGWASAVLTEGLLTPAGSGYRFAHEELADWLQGAHLDVDAALHRLVHRWYTDPAPPDAAPAPPDAAPGLPVPRHRIGPVLQALLRLHRVHGPSALAERLEGLVGALHRPDAPDDAGDAVWWAARLLREVLARVPDTRPYLRVLRMLADRITDRSLRAGGPGHLGGLAEFGPPFWEGLRLGEDERVDLLRRLVPADGAPAAPGPYETPRPPRYLDSVAALLVADARGVQPLLCRWFGDERPLPAAPGAGVRPTVAGAAQALLYAHRALAVDDLCEALVTTVHPRADELLAALAEDEPSALCRAVDRWAHDDTRPGRRVAAAAYGQLVAGHATTAADRELLRYAALALLARPADRALHGPALGLLVRDPDSRAHHLPRALAAFTDGDPGLPPGSLAAAAHTHPEPVLAAFRARLREAGAETGRGARAEGVLAALADLHTPALARRAAALVHEYVVLHPEGAAHAAAYLDRRLEHGPAARAVLLPLVAGLLQDRPAQARAELARILAAPGTGTSGPLRDELLDVLLEYEYDRRAERDLAVPEALLRAVALGAAHRPELRTRELVHRTGLLMVRTPEGATRFDRLLVELAREVPGFAALTAGWLAEAPEDWVLVVGPSTRWTVGTLGRPMPMRAGSHGHGSLRPA